MRVGVDNQRHPGLNQPAPVAWMGKEPPRMVGIRLGVDFHGQWPFGMARVVADYPVYQVGDKRLIPLLILYAWLEI